MAGGFVYQLQNVSLSTLGKNRFDLATMDHSRDGSDWARYTAPQIAALRDSTGGETLLPSYTSIGEAEDHR